ncbi:MAG: nucleotide-binding protein [Rectinemataceae bacterium]|nr:nucleotide-binding protein [Rectinemataceae bacterium]
MSIADRLTGDSDRRLLTDLLRRQALIEGSHTVAESLAAQCQLVSLPANTVILRQGDPDNDLYLILSGRVRILVNEREVASRGAGQHVGEMALVDAASKRTATVVTVEPSVLARVSERIFTVIANANPFLWRNISIELVRRLDERRKFHHSPNPHPFIFIGSSREGLPIASALASAIPKDTALVTLWSEGVFGASNFPIEDLSALLRSADFAALLASADDTVVTRGKEFYTPRDNIVFELGLFMGALSRQRTFLIVPQGVDIKIPSDLLGINTIRFNPGAPTPDDAVHGAAAEIVAMIKNIGTR